jgi:hypothetical protein
LADFSRRKQHTSGNLSAPEAFLGVELSIGASNVVTPRKSQAAGDAINRSGRTLYLEENAYRSFIEVQMDPTQVEGRPKFLVPEFRSKPQRPKP